MQKNHFFSSGYLTLISLIQATVFGVLIFRIDKLLSTKVMVAKLPFLIFEFLGIIAITYVYIVGSRDLLWRIDLFDIIIPYLIGLLECISILTISDKANDEFYWFVLGFLRLLGCAIVLANAWVKTKREKYQYGKNGRIAIYKVHISNFRIFLVYIFILSLVYAFSCTMCYKYHYGTNFQERMAIILSLGACGGIIAIFRWDHNLLTAKEGKPSGKRPYPTD